MGRAPRADAVRNRERIVEVAREAFAAEGPGASLNEIARGAGIGPGTLYRHFPTRTALLAAVLRDRIERLRRLGDELAATRPPDEALAGWLRAFLAHAGTDHGLTGHLLVEEPGEAGLGFDCHQVILDAVAALLERARREGTVRAGLRADDMIKLVAGIALASADGTDPERPGRMLEVVLDGLRG